SVSIHDIVEVMLLGEDLIHNTSVIIPRGTALTATHLKRLVKFDFKDIIIDDSAEEKKELEKNTPKIESSLVKKLYKTGEYIVIQGEESEALYILIEGELDVIYTDEALLSGAEDTIDKIRLIERAGKKISTIRGKMVNFGVLGAILGDTRSATISALVDSKVARINVSGDAFNKTIIQNARLGLNISITIAKRLKDINVYIAKYNNILSQVDGMVREFSSIYVTIAGKVLKQAIFSGDRELTKIHEEFKNSPLYNRLLKYKKQGFDASKMGTSSVVGKDNDQIFAGGDVIGKKAGEIICYNGETGDKMYVLVVGKLGVYVGDKLVAVYSEKGDIVGEISVLLGYATKGSGMDKRTATVKAMVRSRLVCISIKDVDNLVKTNPTMILHITRVLAERLKNCNQVFIQAQKDAQNYMDKLAVKEGSCGSEIGHILELFSENVNLIELCQNEVKVLSKMRDAIDSKYDVLADRLDSISI
ncbi:cyclic nucleotide-binding domain-containing protein, partial [bacterium]|nr:cyclic nucleotide-binding domain-containing protein [bacterium]